MSVCMYVTTLTVLRENLYQVINYVPQVNTSNNDEVLLE